MSTRIEVADGAKVCAKAIYKDPEKYFTKEILDQLDVICQKEFAYGSEIENDGREVLGGESINTDSENGN